MSVAKVLFGFMARHPTADRGAARLLASMPDRRRGTSRCLARMYDRDRLRAPEAAARCRFPGDTSRGASGWRNGVGNRVRAAQNDRPGDADRPAGITARRPDGHMGPATG